AAGATGPPWPGPAVAALLLGVALRPALLRQLPGGSADPVAPGLRWAASRLLQAGVVVLGVTVPVSALAGVGLRALPVVAAVVVTALLTAHLVGRALGVPPTVRLLIGAGTGVCGASAVAATSAVVRARPADTSYALGVVVLSNLAGVLALPLLALGLGLPDAAAAAWVGATVADTSAVVAVAGAWGAAALAVATVVKLVRVLLLVPLTAALAWRHREAGARAGVPGFVVLFAAAVGLAATGLLPAAVLAAAPTLVALLLTLALAGVGLGTDLAAVRRAGARPLVLGAVTWVAVVTVALGLVRLLLPG
ncbi:putative sulfate exporter family transporter, partial [Aquipuribacter sp. SD81]|uniref:putative sulfate exporter family transporter n=1 Tax=Aquipuribacter sp. SD81 TaxID=3127703 RepID=UPI003015B53E